MSHLNLMVLYGGQPAPSGFFIYPAYEGSRCLWNVGILLPDYTASFPKCSDFRCHSFSASFITCADTVDTDRRRYVTTDNSDLQTRMSALCVLFKVIAGYSLIFTLLLIVLQWLATGWTVLGSNPGGGEIFRTRPHRPWGSTQPPVQRVPVLSRG